MDAAARAFWSVANRRRTGRYEVPPRWWQPNGGTGLVHSVVLPPAALVPGQSHRFAVGGVCRGQSAFSATHSFVAPRRSPHWPTRVAMFGDHGLLPAAVRAALVQLRAGSAVT